MRRFRSMVVPPESRGLRSTMDMWSAVEATFEPLFDSGHVCGGQCAGELGVVDGQRPKDRAVLPARVLDGLVRDVATDDAYSLGSGGHGLQQHRQDRVAEH